MKLQVTNPNKIVQNAFTRETDLSFSLIINTVHKWITPDRYGNYIDRFAVTYKAKHTVLPDSIFLFAENDHDNGILRRVRFNLIEKDQLWILFPVERVYETK